MHSMMRHWAAYSSSKDAADKFVTTFKHSVEVETFILQDVFNIDETGLIPVEIDTYISRVISQ